ncbi:uroporphyrinogen-III synthase [Mammaliicoccus sp. Dog046]|uniref:uroporphyrinogen-III synthase n=1 Tax=Mammaliicoccus sp. Dog046 TaxID=3034233 RepID=UPI002B25A9F0|nr:uroporphyrinogen-III synthase [Mammaliicoccus sp. Dog046]WQK86489.1 uroporphyrinogen-III synthase [Mammaliicoccus sp. Dog046]
MKPIIVVTSTRTVQREDVEIRHYPFIDIVPIPIDQSNLRTHYDWLIFTSVNAIQIFEPFLKEINVDHIAVIGANTKKMAEQLNISVDKMPETYTQEGLIESFKKQMSQQNILIPCSKYARDKLTDQLSKWQNRVQRLHIYEPLTVEKHIHQVHQFIENKEITHITFSSSSAVRSYFDVYGPIDPSIEVLAIGEITQATLNTYHQPSKLANKPSLEGMVNTIVEEV